MDNTVTVLSMNVKGLFSSVKKRNENIRYYIGVQVDRRIKRWKNPILV
jgi:hypothetical protein